MQCSKDNKTNIRKGFVGFVKVGKQNKTMRTSYLMKVTKYWSIQHHDKFACFNYPYSNQIFYKKVIMIVRLAATPLRCKIGIRKLYNIIIN